MGFNSRYNASRCIDTAILGRAGSQALSSLINVFHVLLRQRVLHISSKISFFVVPSLS